MFIEWEKIESILTTFSLFLLFVFMMTAGVPVVGYLIQIATISAVLFLAIRRKFILLGIGCIGSLIAAILMYNFSFFLIVMWAAVIVPSVVLGGLIASGVKPSRALTGSILFSVLISLLVFWMQKDLIYASIDDSMRSFTGFLGNLGEENQSGRYLVEEVETIFMTVKRLIPSFIVLSGISQIFVGWFALYLLYRLTGQFFPLLNSFIYWKMPYNYIYIIGFFILIRLLGGETLELIADNVILFIGFFYALFGFSVFEYYLKKIRLSRFLRILFYIGFIFLQLPGLIVAALVGLFDSYFDFRKVRARIIG